MLPIWCLMGWLYTCMLTNFSSTENVDLSGLNYTSRILNTHFKGSKFVRAQQIPHEQKPNASQKLPHLFLLCFPAVPLSTNPPLPVYCVCNCHLTPVVPLRVISAWN